MTAPVRLTLRPRTSRAHRHTASAGVPAQRERLVRSAKALSWLSLGWMTVEGAVAIVAALATGSVALFGFGLDSAIEAIASLIVIWRFTGNRRVSEDAERHAQKLVAISFFLLAAYIAQDAIRTLLAGHHPSTSWVGIGLAVSSIVIMPLLGHAKQVIGAQLGSDATAGEGAQNLLCAYMAAGVLIGLLANLVLGAWWLDPDDRADHLGARRPRRPRGLGRRGLRLLRDPRLGGPRKGEPRPVRRLTFVRS